MTDLPAGALANLNSVSPTRTRPTLAATPRTEADASQALTASTDSDAQATDGDRVTILSSQGLPQSEAPAGIDTSNLQAMLQGLRGTSQSGAQQGASGGIAGLSMQDMLDAFGQSQISNRLQNLGGQLQDWLERLSSYDPEQAQRLALLMNFLAQLQPENAETVFGRVLNALQAFSDIFSGGDSLGEIAEAASVQVSQQQASSSTQIVQFSLDIEVAMSSTTETVLAQMRDEGIEVQTTSVSQSQTMKIHIEFTGISQQVRRSDPLVLDLAGDGIDLTDAAGGVDFDINADGTTDRTAFVQGDDALLAIDRNGNGVIDDGSELFGDQNGAANGFEELAKYDDNGDGKIDARDKVYESLRLLHDVDGDGLANAFELSKLSDLGIASLDLGYSASGRTSDGNGNVLAETSAFTRADGTQGGLVDVWLGYQG